MPASELGTRTASIFVRIDRTVHCDFFATNSASVSTLNHSVTEILELDSWSAVTGQVELAVHDGNLFQFRPRRNGA